MAEILKSATRHNPFDEGYYAEDELRGFGFKRVGKNVRIARSCTIIGLENISIGDHVRIDSHVVIAAASNQVVLGSYIHIGGGSYLSAAGGITMLDFSGLSQGVRLYSASDDFSGNALVGPTIPHEFLNVTRAPIVLNQFVAMGSGSMVLPGCTIGEGAAVGALSLVTKSLEPWGIYFGCPAKRLKARSKKLLELAAQLRQSPPSTEPGSNAK